MVFSETIIWGSHLLFDTGNTGDSKSVGVSVWEEFGLSILKQFEYSETKATQLVHIVGQRRRIILLQGQFQEPIYHINKEALHMNWVMSRMEKMSINSTEIQR